MEPYTEVRTELVEMPTQRSYQEAREWSNSWLRNQEKCKEAMLVSEFYFFIIVIISSRPPQLIVAASCELKTLLNLLLER